MTDLEYSVDRRITADQLIDVLRRSTLGERRPIDDRTCIEGMLEHADLLVTAWQGDTLVGVARSVTDFHYCCYLSDLAVAADLQKRGIGKQLMARTRQQLGSKCKLILLAAQAAASYYPHLGFEQHHSAWILHGEEEA